jgi:hypothetical protein
VERSAREILSLFGGALKYRRILCGIPQARRVEVSEDDLFQIVADGDFARPPAPTR